MAAAADIATAAYESLHERGLAGRTERDVVVELVRFMEDQGSEPPCFSPIVASGAHGALPHAVPRDVEIPRDTLVVIDMGARVDGYCSDCTRTIATGVAHRTRCRRCTSSCGARSARRWRPRRPGRSAGRSTRWRARSSTPPGTRSTSATGSGTAWGSRCTRGRGSGKTAEGALAAGNAVTVEPGVYLPGEFGVRIEDLVDRDGRRSRGSSPRSRRTSSRSADAARRRGGVRGSVRPVRHRDGVRAGAVAGAVRGDGPRGGGHRRAHPRRGAVRAGPRRRAARVGHARARPPARCRRCPGWRWGWCCWRRSRRRRSRSAWASSWSWRPLWQLRHGAAALRLSAVVAGFSVRRAHHLDQRERPAARAVARVGARSAGRVPRHAGRRVPDPGRRGHRADRVQGGRPTWSIQGSSARSWPAFSWATGSARRASGAWTPSASRRSCPCVVICTGLASVAAGIL